jgi:hypothetical protein
VDHRLDDEETAMGLFRRETAQEREAREAVRLREQEEAERRLAEREREAALAREREDAFTATLPKYQYLAVQVSADMVDSGGTFGAERLTDLLNRYAADGWRLRELAMTGKIEQDFAADRNDAYLVFERPAPPSAGTAGPA